MGWIESSKLFRTKKKIWREQKGRRNTSYRNKIKGKTLGPHGKGKVEREKLLTVKKEEPLMRDGGTEPYRVRKQP